jgi:two-component system, OmpR family, phosphate regulon response regulator PhoB
VSGPRVLVVDDDRTSRVLARAALEHDGFDVVEAAEGSDALDVLARDQTDLVVLDVNLPAMGGFEVLAKVRLRHSLPVIMLTGRDSETDRVLGLELGADDYIVKPFSPRELASRVRAVLRRTAPESAVSEHLVHGPLRIDLTTREASLDGKLVDLTTREFDLLAFLAKSPRRVYSRAQLLDHVWSSTPDWQDSATVTEHVRRLRAKIERDGDHAWIRTVRGVGYAFEPLPR